MLALQMMPARLSAARPAPARVDAATILPRLPALVPATVEAPGIAALFELTLRSPPYGDLARLLGDAGANRADAREAVRLIRERLGGQIDQSADIKLGLGAEVASGGRSIVTLALITDLGMERVERGPGGLSLAAPATARRISAIVDGGSYWSLRAAGLGPEVAAQAARLAEQRLGAGPGATIEAVVGDRPARFGTATAPRLLFVAVARTGQPTRRLLSSPGAGEVWLDPDRLAPPPSAMARPVAGRVTSGFGARFHPILNFFRAHRGVDFAARSGEAVRAAADGCVTRSGWSGGYGRQVRLAHRGALGSSYSHLSSLSVGAGQCVRRGDVIGLAGASGLATGPHLHFELHHAGQAVDPLRRLSGPGGVDLEQRRAIAARLTRLERAPRA